MGTSTFWTSTFWTSTRVVEHAAVVVDEPHALHHGGDEQTYFTGEATGHPEVGGVDHLGVVDGHCGLGRELVVHGGAHGVGVADAFSEDGETGREGPAQRECRCAA